MGSKNINAKLERYLLTTEYLVSHFVTRALSVAFHVYHCECRTPLGSDLIFQNEHLVKGSSGKSSCFYSPVPKINFLRR